MPKNDEIRHETRPSPGSNEDLQGNDKAPGEEQGQGEKVTNKDLKGKKVDEDLTRDEDQPVKTIGRGEEFQQPPSSQ